MKKILLSVFVAFCFFSSGAQTPLFPWQKVVTPYAYDKIGGEKILIFPKDTVIGPKDSAYAAIATKNGHVFIFDTVGGIKHWQEPIGTGGGSSTANIKTFTNVAALKASSFHLTSGDLLATTQYYTQKADAGGSSYYWDAISTETVDDIFVIKPTSVSGAGRWKKQFKGIVNAKEAGILADGTNQTTRLNTIFANATVKTVLLNDGDVTINGTVDLSGKTLKIENGARLKGSGVITGGSIENPNRTQVFDLSGGLDVTDLTNSEIYAEWFGVKPDALFDGTTVSPTDNAPLLQAAINAGVNRNTGVAYVFRSKVSVGSCPAGYAFYLGSTVLWNCSLEFSGTGINSTIFVRTGGVAFRYTYPVDVTNTGAEYFTAHDFSVFGDYSFYCPGYFDEDYNGIEIDNTNGYFYNVRVYSFRGNGWTFHGSGAGISIADNNLLIYCSAYQCGGDGVEFSGGDANNNTLILFNAYGNARLGDDDNSFLGNDVDLHASSNGVENTFNRSSVSYLGNRYFCKANNNINHLPTDTDYWELHEAGGASAFFPAWDPGTEYFIGGDFNLRGVNQKGTLTGTYSEGGQYQPPNGGRNVIIGGFGAGKRVGSLSVEEGVLSTPSFRAFNDQENLGLSLLGEGYNKIGVNDYDNGIFPGFKYNKARKVLMYATGEYSGSATEFLANGSDISTGRTDANNTNRMALFGFFIGRQNVGDYRYLNGRTNMPNGTDDAGKEHAASDFYLNFGTDTTIVGWKCTVAGTPGTWVAIRSGNGVTGGSIGTDVYLGNVLETGFDTTLFFPTYNDNLILAKATKVTGSKSVVATRTVTDSTIHDDFELDGDLATPGNSKYYGTDGSGVKGWYTVGSGSFSFTDGSGFDGTITGSALSLTTTVGDKQVMYSNSGAVTGSSDFLWDNTSKVLEMNGASGASVRFKVGGTNTWQWENASDISLYNYAESRYLYTFGGSGKFTIDPPTATATGTVMLELKRGTAAFAFLRVGNSSFSDVSLNFGNSSNSGAFIEYDNSSKLNFYTGASSTLAAVINDAQSIIYSPLRLSNYTGTGSQLLYVDGSGNTGRTSINIGDVETTDAVISVPDANYTVTNVKAFYDLASASTSRSFTLPSAAYSVVKTMIIRNANASTNWSFAGTAVKDATGATVTTIAGNSVYYLVPNGTNWVIVN